MQPRPVLALGHMEQIDNHYSQGSAGTVLQVRPLLMTSVHLLLSLAGVISNHRPVCYLSPQMTKLTSSLLEGTLASKSQQLRSVSVKEYIRQMCQEL